MIEISGIDLLGLVCGVGSVITAIIGSWMFFDWHKEFSEWSYGFPISMWSFSVLLAVFLWSLYNVEIVV